MKKALVGLLSALCLIPLTSCSKNIHHNIEEYILESEYKDDFRILQLTDIHLANKDDRARQYKIMQKTIDHSNPDMIIATGDLFTFGTRKVAKELCDFLDKQGLPWTLTFGNHDEQCYFPIEWFTNYLNNYGSNCLFKDIQDDDVFGNANFAINLNKDGKIFEQIIIMDSNRYNYGEYTGYDYIKQDQIEWYEDLVNYTTAQNEGHVVTSQLFFHIPVPEFEDAYNELGEASFIGDGDKREGFSVPKYNSGMFDKILELGSSKSINVGHDHLNDFTLIYKGVYLSYGVTSTDRIYSDDDKIGGKVLVIHNDHTIEYESFYEVYDR